jgi:trimethylamine---corrinoid protein Co-methyltransferase
VDRRGVFQPLQRITTGQCQTLHEAALEVLERTGLRIFQDEALGLLVKAGARISDGNRAYIPARLVEQALSTLPRTVTLYDRHGKPAIVLDGYLSYFGTGSDCFNIIDHRTWERRRAVLRDVEEAVILVDALPNIDFCMSMFMPGDVGNTIADRYQMELMLSRTTKPVVFINYELQGCLDSVRMAEMVAGSAQALAERPFVAGYVNVTSGLRFDAESIEKHLFLAGKGLPIVFVAGAAAGLNTPITPAGSVVTQHVGSLAGVVLAQLKRPGTPVIIPGGLGGGLDMRTLVLAYGEPEPRGTAQALVHSLGLPIFSTGGASDSHVVDEQAAIEAALTMLTDALSGGHLVHDVGYLEQAMCGSLAHIAICDEIANWIRAFTAPIDVSDETLALELIDEVGPDGQFLDTEHTRRHYRERWYPKLFERGNYEHWVNKGSKTLGQRAAEKVDKILSSHRPEPLPSDVAERIHEIVARAAGQQPT